MERECRTDIATPVRCSLVEGQAFEAAFTANFQSVHRFLARRVGSALADDLAAETFAIAFRRRDSFDASLGEVRAWLFGITTNLLRAHWREEQHLFALEARIMGEPGPPMTENDDDALARWIAPRLARALGLLSQDQRDVLLLHAWAELSSEEIATIVGEPGPPAMESDDKALARWLAPRLARALGLLSQDQRDVLLLHASAELSSEEIATIMGAPAGSIRSRLSRARAELRDYLGNFDFDLWLFDEQPTPTQEDPDR